MQSQTDPIVKNARIILTRGNYVLYRVSYSNDLCGSVCVVCGRGKYNIVFVNIYLISRILSIMLLAAYSETRDMTFTR